MFKKISIIVSFLVIAIGVSVFVVLTAGRHELVKQENAWRAMGGVFDFSEMAPDAIPDKENAAVVYGVAFAFLDGLSVYENNLLGKDPAKNPGGVAVLDKCKGLIIQLRNASKMEKCRWDIDYAAGINTEFPHLSKVRTAARLLASDAYQSLEEGHDDEVVRDIEAMLQMGLHVANGSTIIEQLVAIAIVKEGVLLYENLFRDHIAPANEVVKIVSGYDDREMFHRSLMGEVAMSRSAIEDVMNDPQYSILRYTKFLLPWDRAYYLRHMIIWAKDCDKPYFEKPVVDEEHIPYYAPTSNIILPAFSRAVATLAKGRLLITMLETAEKLRAYKTKHGGYPEVGEVREVEMPIDPVTGKRLVYERVGEGFVLTSEVKDGNGKNTEWRWD